MDKEKQIEEMARICCEGENTCSECFDLNERLLGIRIKDRGEHCQAYNYAEKFYNAGYRKIDENSVVLTREEHQKYCAYKIIEPQIRGCLDREIKLEKANTELQELNAKYYNEAKDLRRELKQARKEMVEKFANFIKGKLFELGNIVNERDIDDMLKEFCDENQ